MKILYISHLVAAAESGPTWSVPACIEAQSLIDEVLWINTTKKVMPNWEVLPFFMWLKDKPLKLKNIPDPFNNPDIVVFEAIYDSFQEIFFSRELRKNNIPYVIVPRGSLTYAAMHNKSRFKKELAHFLFYDNYIHKASAIQYLTDREYEDSKYRFEGPHFVIPNGFNRPKVRKTSFSSKGIKAVFIGRFDAYHKGLDIIVQAFMNLRSTIREVGLEVNLYGTETNDWKDLKTLIEKERIEDIVKLNGPIVGKEKEDVLLGSDAFIMASRFEGHPMGLIEALSYGLPVVITRGTNMLDEIEQSKAGWVCESEEKAFEEALIKMIAEKDKFNEFSKNAIALSEKYDWSNLARLFHEEIKGILNK